MADRARLIQALQDADAAGDTEAAQAFADAIRQSEPAPQAAYKPRVLPLRRGPNGIEFTHSDLTEALTRGVTNPRDVLTGKIAPTMDNLKQAGMETAGVVTTGNIALPRAIMPAGSMTMNAVGPPIKRAAQGVATVAKAVAEPIANRFDIEGGTGKALLKRIMDQNPEMTPDEAISATELQLYRLGPQGNLADTGISTRNLARNMAQAPGQSGQRARNVLGDRDASEGSRMVESVQRNVSDAPFYDAAAEARKGRQQSGPVFKQAYDEHQNLSSDKLRLFIEQEPAVKKAMNIGLAMERTAASDAGEVFDPGSFGVITKFNEAGDPIIEQFQRTPLKLWHVTKRGIDSMLAKKKNALGKLDMTDPEVDSLVTLRKSIDSELKTRTGGEEGAYARANKMASESYKLEDALNSGRDFAKGDQEITEKMFKSFTPQEQDAYRAGVAREMTGMIRKSGQTPAAIRNAMRDTGVRDKLKVILPTETQFNRFIDDLEREAMFKETNRGIRNVSQTGSIAMEEGAIANDAIEASQRGTGIMMDLGRGNTAAALSKGVDWAFSQIRRLQMPMQMRDQLGRLLISNDPADKAEAIRRVRAAAARNDRPPGR
jgi:hypothetical protein